MAKKTIAIVQARTGSTRLPGKTLMPILDKSLLFRQIERMRAAETLDEILVAATTDPGDNPIEEICENENISLFRGHPTDLLDRHYKAAIEFGAEVVLKIPSDCPLIDPAVIDRVANYYRKNADIYDFVSNLHPPSYPDGNDVEIMPFDVLEIAYKRADKDYEREHTTPYIWDEPGRFRVGNVLWERAEKENIDMSMSHRFTVDYREDFDFVNAVYKELYPKKKIFSLDDVLDLLDRKPEIYAINQKYAGVNWYRNHVGELKTIDENRTRKI